MPPPPSATPVIGGVATDGTGVGGVCIGATDGTGASAGVLVLVLVLLACCDF